MKRKFFSLTILLIFLSLSFGTAFAQDYSFQVTHQEVNLFINEDGTVSLDYTWDFSNNDFASAIEFVDVGLPNRSYDISTITADINGKPIHDISKADAEYVEGGIGVTLALGADAIPAGQSGRVNLHVGKIENMIYPSTNKEVSDYASTEFIPSWFGSQYCDGTTDYTFTIFLPAGMEPEEPRWHTPKNWPGPDAPQAGFDDNGRVFYRWQISDANGYSKYTFGASYPDRLIPAEAIVTKPPIDFAAIFGFVFQTCFWGLMCGVPVLIIVFSIRSQKKRKLKYLPPKIKIEGHGIKRGLTAVQAAVVMEQPADKILTMILFSTIKKSAASVTSRNPLKIEVEDSLPGNLQEYEKDFLEAMKLSGSKQNKGLQKLMVDLIKSVTKKMKGFSHKETVAYYQNIIDRAWVQVESAETPEVQMKKYDETMDWTMMDRDFEDRTGRVFRTRPIFVPMWWGRYDPTYRPTSSPRPIIGTSGKPSQASLPHLPGSDFAASMVNGVQDFSANVVGNLATFTSGVTNVTNPIPKTSSSGSRGGGGGCACACACAGCACACAGGGR